MNTWIGTNNNLRDLDPDHMQGEATFQSVSLILIESILTTLQLVLKNYFIVIVTSFNPSLKL